MWTNFGFARRAIVLQGCVLPHALHACAVNHVPARQLARLSSAHLSCATWWYEELQMQRGSCYIVRSRALRGSLSSSDVCLPGDGPSCFIKAVRAPGLFSASVDQQGAAETAW
eukprot:11434850-Karenia_brevis.AAC.1